MHESEDTMTDTELFPDVITQTPLFDKPALIVCLVCGRGGWADMSRPLICDRCGADVPAAQALVDYKLVNAEKNHEAAWDKWAAALDGTDAATRKHYDLYDDVRIERDVAHAVPTDPANVAKANNAERLALAGDTKPVFDLIRLWLDYQGKQEAWQMVREWAKQCDEVLR
jgi:hypothetical protein